MELHHIMSYRISKQEYRETMDNSSTLNAAMLPVFPPELLFNFVAQIGDLELAGSPNLSDFSRTALSNLRLVNKAFHEFATPYLFHTITTWLNLYQFQRLELISSQEHLRHHVKRIVFRPWVLRMLGYGRYLEEVWCCDLRTHNRLMPADLTFANFNDYVQKFSMLPLIGQDRSGYGVFGTTPEIRQMWSPPTYTEAFLRQGHCEYLKAYYIQYHRRTNYVIDQADLKTTFVRFDNLMHITVTPEDARPENNRFVEMTGIAPHPYWYSSGTYLIPIMIGSLKAAKAKVRCLEIDTGRSEHHFWHESIFDIFAQVLNHDPEHLVVFAGLEKLCITDIGKGITNRRPYIDQFSFQTPIARLLETSPSLKELTLGLHKNWRKFYEIQELIPTTLKIEGLRFLTLHWFIVKEEALFVILDSHRSTLRTLNLLNITLQLGTWASLADTLRRNFTLTDTNFSGLSVQHDSLGPNNTHVTNIHQQRSCFAHHRDRDLAGSLDDYVAHKIPYNPITRATGTGYQIRRDDWLPGTAAGSNWKPEAPFLCRCNKHMQIPRV
ncbi:hypothetical protein MMC11_006109 [Xylographa trunciseda]|nr:hypothetical protein [Xylographa trunciseda]